MKITEGMIARFVDKVSPVPESGCWLWAGCTNQHGYGIFVPVTGKNIGAHRFSWLINVGPIPDGLFVLHKCDVPACCNPAHLWLGTQTENLQDMHNKGRGFSYGRTVTHCPAGHEYTPENTRMYQGRRHCRQCDRDRNKGNPDRAQKARERNKRYRATRRKAA